MVHRNLGHHRIQCGTHCVDEFWTVIRHDIFRRCARGEALLVRSLRPLTKLRPHAQVTLPSNISRNFIWRTRRQHLSFNCRLATRQRPRLLAAGGFFWQPLSFRRAGTGRRRSGYGFGRAHCCHQSPPARDTLPPPPGPANTISAHRMAALKKCTDGKKIRGRQIRRVHDGITCTATG